MNESHEVSLNQWVILLVTFAWAALMVWVCGDVMRESDQASLLRGAIELSDGTRDDVWLHNYSGQYGSYWLFAFFYRICSFESLGAFVSFGNALACFSFVAVVLIVSVLRRQRLHLLWLVALTTPCLILSVPLLASNVLAGGCFLGFIGLNLKWGKVWGEVMAALLCFCAVCLRQDIALMLPLACVLSTSKSEVLSLLKIRYHYTFFIAAILALYVGSILSGGSRYMPEALFDIRLIGCYLCFGLLGLLLILPTFICRRFSHSWLFSLLVSVSVILPLAFYLPLLYSPRHLFIVALVPFVFCLSCRRLTFNKWQSLLIQSGLICNALWLSVGLVIPKKDDRFRPRMSFENSLMYPTADGLWPTGAGFAFLQKLKQASQIPIDHNQEVWELWSSIPSEGLPATTWKPEGSLRAYGNLWSVFHGRNVPKESQVSILSDREFFATSGGAQQEGDVQGCESIKPQGNVSVLAQKSGRLLVLSDDLGQSIENEDATLDAEECFKIREMLERKEPRVDFSLIGSHEKAYDQDDGHLYYFVSKQGEVYTVSSSFSKLENSIVARSIYPELLLDLFLR